MVKFNYLKLIILFGLIVSANFVFAAVTDAPSFSESAKPIAISQVSPTEGIAPLKVTLDASQSQGDIEDYTWKISNGEFALGKLTTALFDKPGTYTVVLEIIDKNSLSDIAPAATINVKAAAEESEIIADYSDSVSREGSSNGNFENDKVKGYVSSTEGVAPLTVQLEVSQLQADIDNYKWTASRTSNDEIIVKHGSTVSILFEEADTYKVALTETDKYGTPKTSNVTTIIVKPKNITETYDDGNVEQPPETKPLIAIANVSPLEGVAPLTVTLDGRESTGNIDDYLWKASNGDFTLGKQAELFLENAGTYDITLKVIGKNVVDSVQKTVIVTEKINDDPDNRLPVAAGYASPTEGVAPLKITLESISQGNIEDILWEVSDGQIAYGTLTNLLFKEAGTYTITLEVIDKNGLRDIAKIATITVKSQIDDNTNNSTNSSLKACFTATPSAGNIVKNENGTLEPFDVQLNAGCSEGNIINYQWFVSDGSKWTGGEIASMKFDEIGKYRIILEVRDNVGNRDTDEKEIEVGELCAELRMEPNTIVEWQPVSVYATTCNSAIPVFTQWNRDYSDQVCRRFFSYDPHGTFEAILELLEMPPTDFSCRFTITFTVEDTNGAMVSTSKTISLSEQPIAIITKKPAQNVGCIPQKTLPSITGAAPLEITLFGDASCSRSGNIEEYEWTNTCNNDKSYSEYFTTTFEKNNKECVVNLVVTDSNGLKSEPTHLKILVGMLVFQFFTGEEKLVYKSEHNEFSYNLEDAFKATLNIDLKESLKNCERGASLWVSMKVPPPSFVPSDSIFLYIGEGGLPYAPVWGTWEEDAYEDPIPYHASLPFAPYSSNYILLEFPKYLLKDAQVPANVYTFYADVVQKGVVPNAQDTFNRDVYCMDASGSNIETKVKVRLMD